MAQEKIGWKPFLAKNRTSYSGQSIERYRAFNQANIDQSIGKFDRAISNLPEKSANIDTIFV
jgi:hypothetical protein